MYRQRLHRYLQQYSKETVSQELLGRGHRRCVTIPGQWLHRYLQQFSNEICLTRIIRKGIEGLLSHVKAVVALVPATVF
jgi:hypothetical protein